MVHIDAPHIFLEKVKRETDCLVACQLPSLRTDQISLCKYLNIWIAAYQSIYIALASKILGANYISMPKKLGE